MDNCRTYGEPPYNVVLVHGGPGAAGEMATVARELATGMGVLEPLQTEKSVEGQIQELTSALLEISSPPAIVVGHSWGAWLSILTAARQPNLIKKLILIGMPPLTKDAATSIDSVRLARMNRETQQRFKELQSALQHAAPSDAVAMFRELASITETVDSFDVHPLPLDSIDIQYGIFEPVWRDAEQYRTDGRLFEAARALTCPVVAIHGDYDPHPAEAVRAGLSATVANFTFHILEHCGHYPWRERRAAGLFLKILRASSLI